MLRWLMSWITGTAPTNPVRVNTTTPTGSRVRGPDGLTGTLSGFREVRGDPWGRVVYCGHNTTWVDLHPLAALELS